MLQLTRRAGEAIIIDHRITVRVKRITPSRVILEIDADKGIDVNRQEVETLLRDHPQPSPVANAAAARTGVA